MKTISPAPAHRVLRRALLLGALAALAHPTLAADKPAATGLTPPAPLLLNYTIYGRVGFLPYRASGSLRWWHDGSSYDARMLVEVFLLGARIQTSRGRLNAAGLQPLRFVDRVHNDRTVDFDYEQSRIRFSEGAPPALLPGGAQDHLSVFMQLGSLLAAAPQRYPAGSVIVLPAMGIYGPETWRFLVNGEEKLALPGGEQATVRLTRQPASSDELGGEVWLAPALGWLPARIRLSQPNGDYIDQQWRGSEAP